MCQIFLTLTTLSLVLTIEIQKEFKIKLTKNNVDIKSKKKPFMQPKCTLEFMDPKAIINVSGSFSIFIEQLRIRSLIGTIEPPRKKTGIY